ncbi:MAG TPA: hypothetical protein VJB62_00305 [Patescibacteria group bacterium]|nr:hypothetical protein [Patescibacteria group bacterium]
MTIKTISSMGARRCQSLMVMIRYIGLLTNRDAKTMRFQYIPTFI